MRHASLFSGIGGFDLAASWMGWENVFQVEWDAYCQKVLAKNFPDALRFGDIVEFNKMLQNGEIITDTNGRRGSREERFRENDLRRSEEKEQNNNIITTSERQSDRQINIGHIDIITGGFPCQPFSHAGKRKGTNDSRYLWPEMLTTIRILKPSFVVGENVAGLVSMENGKTLDGILSDLANEGYQTEQFIIPACGVGAWHRRDRIWIIAHNNHTRERTSRSRINGNRTEKIIKWEQSQSELSGYGENVSNSDNQGLQGGEETRNIKGSREKRNKQLTGCSQLLGENGERGRSYWFSEPSVGRVANGIPNRVDRLKGLGNAIVPQVVYQIFKAIEQYES